MKKHYKYDLLGFAAPPGYRKILEGEKLQIEDFLYRTTHDIIEKIMQYPNYVGSIVQEDKYYSTWFWVRKID